MKVWVVVYNYGLITDKVDIFKTLDEAKQAFKKYTGFEFDTKRRYKDISYPEYSEYFEQSDIFNIVV